MCFHMGASPASRCLELETLFYEAWARLVAEQKRATPPTLAHPRLAGCQMCEAVLDFLALAEPAHLRRTTWTTHTRELNGGVRSL